MKRHQQKSSHSPLKVFSSLLTKFKNGAVTLGDDYHAGGKLTCSSFSFRLLRRETYGKLQEKCAREMRAALMCGNFSLFNALSCPYFIQHPSQLKKDSLLRLLNSAPLWVALRRLFSFYPRRAGVAFEYPLAICAESNNNNNSPAPRALVPVQFLYMYIYISWSKHPLCA